MSYLVFSGYHHYYGADWFLKLWYRVLRQQVKDAEVVVIGCGNAVPKYDNLGLTYIMPPGDLGSTGDTLRHERHNFLSSASPVWMLGLWYAYMAQKDAIYVEQDVLAFGQWNARLYTELEGKQAIFGKAKVHGISTSLFLIKHWFIPFFVSQYLHEGPEDTPTRIPEMKIARMAARNPEAYAFHTMGYDTDRPIRLDDPAFYAQKWTPEELKHLTVSPPGNPILDANWLEEMPDVKLFSNRGDRDP